MGTLEEPHMGQKRPADSCGFPGGGEQWMGLGATTLVSPLTTIQEVTASLFPWGRGEI